MSLVKLFNNDLHCVNLLPNRMYKRREYLMTVKKEGIPLLEPVPSWAHSNRFIQSKPVIRKATMNDAKPEYRGGLTNRGEVYLHFLNQAYSEPTTQWNVGLNMYFSRDQEEKNNPKEAHYGKPTYSEVVLMEDVTHPELGLYLNPTGKFFNLDWVKYDEENGYRRKLDAYKKWKDSYHPQNKEEKDVN